jgi:hypothetical protein
MRVIYHYCDDYVTGQCMVTATPAWHGLLQALAAVAGIIFLLHLSMPPEEEPEPRPPAVGPGPKPPSDPIGSTHPAYGSGTYRQPQWRQMREEPNKGAEDQAAVW